MINFVKAVLAIQDYAAREELDSRELSVLLAIFRALNDRRFPAGMVTISNKQLLEKSTLNGSKRDDTLRAVRQKLADRGVIRFTPGDRRKDKPTYCIVWDALGIRETDGQAAAAPQTAPHIAPNNQGKTGGNPFDNIIINNGTVRENEKGRGKGTRPGRRPNLEQVRAYCEEIRYRINPLKFIDYYAARGWPVDDWQAALRVWKIRDEEQAHSTGRRVTAQMYTQRKYSEEELEARANSV